MTDETHNDDETGSDDRERKFGRTEVSIGPLRLEDLTPAQRLAVAAVGFLAIVVGVMGLLGISIRPRDRE